MSALTAGLVSLMLESRWPATAPARMRPAPDRWTAMDDVRIHCGTLIADLRLPHARQLKDRRQALRALIQRLHNQRLAVAQVGPSDLYQRVFLVIGAVAGSSTVLDGLLDTAERMLFASEFEVGDLRRHVRQDSFSSLA
jgi:uncharacterized protein YlxP (DUF503 family)